MNVVFLNSFKKDLLKINQKKLKQQLKSLILEVEAAQNKKEIPGLKKLKGHPTAYRLRLGDYRLGLFMENQTVIMVRFVKRNDIYKIFP